MAVDYISTLNKNGSGLNLTELASSLVAAEVTPKANAAQKKIDKAEVAISSYGTIRAQFEKLDAALTTMKGAQVLQATSSTTAISVAVTDPKRIASGNVDISVDAIAKRQVLEFTGFTDPDAAIGSGTINIEFGAWATDTMFAVNPNLAGSSINVGAGATLTDLADALSQIDGVTARVLDRGDGTYTLGVVSETGAGHAIRLSVTETSAGLAQFDNAADNATHQVQAASDAMLTVDGVTVFRSSNTVTDIIEGATLTLNGPTEYEETISVARDADLAKEMLQTLIDVVNETFQTIDGLTANGLDGNEAGELAGDRTAREMRNQLSKILNKALVGHGAEDIHLSDMGVATSRNGTIFMNTVAFERAFERNPEAFDALFNDSYSSDTTGVTVSGKVGKAAQSGTYDFEYNDITGIGKINGTPTFVTNGTDGSHGFIALSGDLTGLVVTAGPGVNSGKITFGRSLMSELQSSLTEILQSAGTLDKRETALNDVIAAQEAKIKQLDDKAVELEERYLVRFAKMEQVISSLKSTGTYLTNLVDSWNSD